MPPSLLVETRGPVRLITLNRPERRNALNREMSAALLEALDDADGDDGIGAVLLAGAGPTFCAGADLQEQKSFVGEAHAQRKERLERICVLHMKISRMSKPVVGALHGAAIGAGASLALGTDVLLMGESATICFPEIPHGMTPSLMMPALIHATSAKAAFEILFVGDNIGAATAVSMGLANRVCTDASLLATAQALAARIGSSDRATLKAAKRLFKSIAGRTLEDAMATALRAAESK